MHNNIILDDEHKDILKDLNKAISEGFLNEKDNEKWFQDMTNKFNNIKQSIKSN